ncbi:GtrA family protein [Vibrio sp. JC009]|uniref:GtrA family protein n=1 Tax=Vibrio sp. JC009 TaxID=2912314 RepID=UPI0023AFA70B|nr:GtrA family protein [Vibrio sp. JC009]WED23614.1 GtrA family protein [Vibrio sp. JC009]
MYALKAYYPLLSQYLAEKIKSSALFRFALVGGAGFIVDSLVFTGLFYLLEVPLIPARAVAFFCAATTTWWGNRIFTFNSVSKHIFRQWLSFFSGACLSAIPNFAAFSMVIELFGSTGVIPYLALVSGIVAGMFSNYLLCRVWVFAE